MALAVTPCVGANVASDVIAGEHHQQLKMEFGAAGSATFVSTTAPLPTREPVKGSSLSKGGATMGVGSTTLAPANSSRTILEISNGSATTGIWLSFNGPAVAGQGTYLPPKATGFWPTTAAVFGFIESGGSSGGAVGWTEWGV